mgnify:FL=1
MSEKDRLLPDRKLANHTIEQTTLSSQCRKANTAALSILHKTGIGILIASILRPAEQRGGVHNRAAFWQTNAKICGVPLLFFRRREKRDHLDALRIHAAKSCRLLYCCRFRNGVHLFVLFLSCLRIFSPDPKKFP